MFFRTLKEINKLIQERKEIKKHLLQQLEVSQLMLEEQKKMNKNLLQIINNQEYQEEEAIEENMEEDMEEIDLKSIVDELEEIITELE